MKILVTGSEGLIGKALCAKLQKDGYEIIKFDIKFQSQNQFYGDITNRKDLQNSVSSCDGIVHLAAVSRVVWGQINPDECINTNIYGTRNVIEAAINSERRPWILYASSREVYGDAETLPVSENTKYSPINLYAKTKVEAERLMIKARQYGISTAIIRYSNVYGSVSDHYDRVIPAFTRAALSGDEIRVEGALNSFDFTYIDDVVSGTIKTINLLSDSKIELPNLHLTTDKPTALIDAANIINSLGGNISKISKVAARDYDVKNFYGDSSMTRKIIGWSPKIYTHDGFAIFFNDLKNHIRDRDEYFKSDPWLSSEI